tara:strand:- start:410 stop:760 length:351 start_codon:yes stop_codon:yes gene_type:complete
MKTEAFLGIVAVLCAISVPLTCSQSPMPTVQASTQGALPVQVKVDELEDITEDTAQSKDQTVGDVVIDSIQSNSSKMDEGMSEIQRDIEELKKRKKIKKKKIITKKKTTKKKIIDK